jgi:ATP-grasp domain
MRSVARLLSRAGFRCDAISSDRRLARAGVVQRVVPLERAPRWIEAALGWQARTGGMVVPCDDDLIRQVRDAAIDGAAKCRLLPITGPEHLGHVGSKVGLARALEKADVAAPRFAVVESAGDLVAVCETIGYPLVVKVDESGGGQGVFACGSRAEAEALAARSLRLPLLVQELIDGDLIDLSGFFRGGRPVHFVYNQYLKNVGSRFGVSKLRRYTQLADLDRAVFESLVHVGETLGLDGFVNFSAMRPRDDGRLLSIEADIRPNAWVEASRLFGDDPAPAIRGALEEGRVLTWPPPRPPGFPTTVELAYPFRLHPWEILTNRHGVWRTLGEHDRVDILRYLGSQAWRSFSGLLKRLRRG